MIDVSLTIDSSQGPVEIGRIEIIKVRDKPNSMADYSVRFAIDRAGAVGMHQRAVLDFPRTKYNVLGLLTLALQTLSPEELSLEHGTEASDLARRQRRARLPLSP